MAWIAMGAIFLTGGAVVWEGAKGLREPTPGQERKTSKGTAYTTIVVGVLIMIVGAVTPFVAF
ncbi:hypothetical protein GobsT_57460 [Gemmata obscuriglobus]|uniref:Uncharacterized protein n=1 Tax=Gemmata obscuriglobus TaxID=114 RepID=A0A2Z3H669_9BACT|nr:hypothetical protein C1280_05055 [Gemmata obscuriglobus]QEG30928.1 hypothetical protein GobsT_57460 [Gemmata obscuriglobus]VTS10261.1 unnamed protein product [Gemmata obscuriglobus UQM 2246]